MQLSNIAGALSLGNTTLNFVANADQQRHTARLGVINGAIDQLQQASQLVERAGRAVMTGGPRMDWREVSRQVQAKYEDARTMLTRAGMGVLLPDVPSSGLGQFSPPPLGPAFAQSPPSAGATTAFSPQGVLPGNIPPGLKVHAAQEGTLYARMNAALFGHLQTLLMAREELSNVKVPTAGLGALMAPGVPDPNLLYSRLFWLGLIGLAGYHGYKRNDASWQKAALWALPGLLGGTRLAGVVAFVALYQGLGEKPKAKNDEKKEVSP